jgi:hypothetical protein
MFFTDDDLYQGLKLSLETLTQLTASEKDPVSKRKCAKALSSVILTIMKMQSDKEDLKILMADDNNKNDEDSTNDPF